MRERQSRLKVIKQLITTNTIESQDELLALLLKEDYDVTQATLSRDLKFLKIGKVPDGLNGYKYAFQEEEIKTTGQKYGLQDGDDMNDKEIYIQDFLRGYLSINHGGNIVVIKTHPGHANTVCNAIDNLNVKDVLGTVAGDNCLFACMKDEVAASNFLTSLKEIIPELNVM